VAPLKFWKLKTMAKIDVGNLPFTTTAGGRSGGGRGRRFR
jgi:hypothetical protein